MKLTSCWIKKQERPLCFQISSFTSSNKQKEDEKVGKIPTIDFTFFLIFLPCKMGVLNEKRCKTINNTYFILVWDLKGTTSSLSIAQKMFLQF